jgi:transposase
VVTTCASFRRSMGRPADRRNHPRDRQRHEGFKTGRDFAAWLGLTPRLLSSGGKEKLGSISKPGNRQLRTLLVVGASSMIKQAKRDVPLPAGLIGLMARKPYKLVAVALANKTARIIWALLANGGVYRKPQMTTAAA